ncbi:hypothetical protein [Streptomyces sp. NPDC051572]|uniref:hypothetical protein n=1 Tax=Streptomyces sp. NPDC051572 TaxID=3155802 RepID=UPI00344DF041
MPEEWTAERAERHLTALAAGARLFTVRVTDAGSVSVVDLRARLISVRGCRTACGFALRRGVREGWWPGRGTNGTASNAKHLILAHACPAGGRFVVAV